MSTLVLASASGIRARLLREAGVRFGVRPAEVDEDQTKRDFQTQNRPHEDLADVLAALKAVSVSKTSPEVVVLGCDQILSCDGRLFDKARNLDEARKTLASLRGKMHTLTTSCALARNGQPFWQHREQASLWMRPFSEDFLEDYLKSEGRSILGSVGCYQFEARGIQLFERVSGDFFAILGLPLVAVLTALRHEGILPQ